MPSSFSKLLVIRFTLHTSGYSSFNKGVKMKEAGKAIFSGYNAASVLGVTSANIRITNVRRAVAIAIPASPHNLSAIMVAIDDANILTKLLPIRMTPIN